MPSYKIASFDETTVVSPGGTIRRERVPKLYKVNTNGDFAVLSQTDTGKHFKAITAVGKLGGNSKVSRLLPPDELKEDPTSSGLVPMGQVVKQEPTFDKTSVVAKPFRKSERLTIKKAEEALPVPEPPKMKVSVALLNCNSKISVNHPDGTVKEELVNKFIEKGHAALLNDFLNINQGTVVASHTLKGRIANESRKGRVSKKSGISKKKKSQ